MEIRENLELVAVDFESNNQKAVMTFLDQERAEVRIVNWNKQDFENGKYIPSEDKAAKVEKWASEIFGTDFVSLPSCVGQRKTVYCYDSFNSLFPSTYPVKFTADMVGQIYQTEVKEIVEKDYAIRFRYEIDGNLYESKHSYSKWIDATKSYLLDPIKKTKVYATFEDKYGVPVERMQELVGHPLMVEVKSAFGGAYYGDIKKFPKAKK